MNCNPATIVGKELGDICKCGHSIAVHMMDGKDVVCQICDLREYLTEEIYIALDDIISGRQTLHEAMKLVSEKLDV